MPVNARNSDVGKGNRPKAQQNRRSLGRTPNRSAPTPLTMACFSGFDPLPMAQGSQAIRELSSVPGEGNSLGR